MKIKITMKDPDGFYESVSDEVGLECEKLGLDNDETELIKESRVEKVKEIASKWFEYSEYITVEIDTEAKTCVVVPVKQ